MQAGLGRLQNLPLSQLRFNSTDFPPFKAYGVEGWWLDNLLKAGKLTRQTYLRVAAQVTVGFQKRSGDCKAAERYLHDQAIRDAVQAESKALESAMLPMKTFGPVEVGLELARLQDLSWTPTVAVSVDVTPPPGVRGLPRRTASLPPSHTCNRGRHALG